MFSSDDLDGEVDERGRSSGYSIIFNSKRRRDRERLGYDHYNEGEKCEWLELDAPHDGNHQGTCHEK